MQIDRSIARAVKSAESAYQDALTKRQVAEERADKLRGRIAALQDERQAIIQSRSNAPLALPDDKVGGRLALINADIEGLTPLLAKAEQEALALDPTAALRAFEAATANFERHMTEVEFTGLAQKAREAQEHLVNVISALHTAGSKLGRRQLSMNWVQTSNFRNLVNYGKLPG